MPLFGKKKKDSGKDIEAAEEDGLLMQTAGAPAGDQAVPAPPVAEAPPEEGAPVDSDEPLYDDSTAALAGPDETEGEQPENSDEEGESEPATLSVVASSEESKDDDILSMFDDNESYGDLAELTKDIEDINAMDLLTELREIRSMLPAEALEDQQAA